MADRGADNNSFREFTLELLTKLAAALGTTAGLLTMLGVAGAWLMWVRLNAAQIPANESVQFAGISGFVVDGATSMAVFIAIGLLASGIVYAIALDDDKIQCRTYLVLFALATVETISVLAVRLALRWVQGN